MKLTDRDKELLIVLGIILVLVLPYYGVVKPISDKTLLLNTDITSLQTRYEYLNGLNNSKDFYNGEIARFQTEKETILSKYPADIRQESSVMFFNDTERLLPISLYQMNTNDIVELPISGGSAAVSSNSTPVQQVGTLDTTQGITVDISNQLQGKSTVTQFSYQSSYESYKKLLNYIATNGKRMVISSITANYDESQQMVKGEMTLIEYAISGNGRVMPETNTNVTQLGRGNIFAGGVAANPVNQDNARDKSDEEAYDLFVMLNQPEADVSAKIVGIANDVNGETYLKSGTNKNETIILTVDGSEGLYTVSYQIGDKKYPESNFEKGYSFEPGKSLDLNIMSSTRADESDKVSADIELINHSDMTLNVSVTNDDETNNRVNITGKTGSISIQ